MPAAQQTLQSTEAACALAMQGIGITPLDQRHRVLIEALGLGLRSKVTQISRDRDHRFLFAPQGIDHGGDLHHRYLPDSYRQDLGPRQRPLDEGQLHFDAVLASVGFVITNDFGQIKRNRSSHPVDRNRAKRGIPFVRVRHRHARQRHPVRRSEDHHALNHPGLGSQTRPGTRCHRSAETPAGMRHHQYLARPVQLSGRQQIVSDIAQHHRVFRVKDARHRRLTNTAHQAFILTAAMADSSPNGTRL